MDTLYLRHHVLVLAFIILAKDPPAPAVTLTSWNLGSESAATTTSLDDLKWRSFYLVAPSQRTLRRVRNCFSVDLLKSLSGLISSSRSSTSSTSDFA